MFYLSWGAGGLTLIHYHLSVDVRIHYLGMGLGGKSKEGRFGRDFCGSSEQKGDPLRPEDLEEGKISKAKVETQKG